MGRGTSPIACLNEKGSRVDLSAWMVHAKNSSAGSM